MGFNQHLLDSQLLICQVFAVFLIGVAVRHASKVLQVPVPYTVIVFLVGTILGFLPLGSIANVGPYTIIHLFIPILIFEGAFAIDVYVFKQIFLQVLLMAYPALVVMILLTAVISILLFKIDNWDWTSAMMFGSILSATDPVAVVAIMKELGVKKYLSLLIEGESMLNDGTAMVFFHIFYDSAKDTDHKHEGMLEFMLHLTLLVFVKSVFGALLGYIVAKISVFWLNWTFNESLTEISITLFVSYLTFYIGEELLDVSGVLALVTCGVVIKGHKTCFSPEVETYLHRFWETMSFLANTMIFALCGVIITKKVLYHAKLADISIFMILYCMIQIIRGVTFLLFVPILNRIGPNMTWQDVVVASWSGLRGAVGLALSLIVFLTFDNNKTAVKNEVLFHVSLIVVATLFINATTVQSLLRLLGLSGVKLETKLAMQKAINMLDEGRVRSMMVWKIDRFLTDANWDVVSNFCTIKYPYSSRKGETEIALRSRQLVCPKCQATIPYIPTHEEMFKMRAEAIRKLLTLYKKSFKEQFEQGTLSGFGFRTLGEIVDHKYSTDLDLISARDLTSLWRVPNWIERLGARTKNWIVESDCEVLDRSKSWRAYCRWRSHWLVLTIIYITPLLINESAEILRTFKLLNENLYICINNSYWVSIMFSIIFFVFRIIVFQIAYLRTPWFILDVLAVTLNVIDFIHEEIFQELGVTARFTERQKFTRSSVFYIIRSFQAICLIELINYGIHHKVKQKKMNKLKDFFDMARAYIRAHDVIVHNIEYISDNESITNSLLTFANINKTEVHRELGLVQGSHPSIALEVKTSQAIRSVLNVMRDAIYDLRDEGGIDEMESSLFIRVIENKMKRLWAAPPKPEEPTITKILARIPWIENNKDVIEHIKEHGIMMEFPEGKSIIKAGELAGGIYVILNGLIKVETATSGSMLTDFLAMGNTAGEISTLTMQPRAATLTCESLVRALYISKEHLQEAIKSFPYLEVRLWRMTAIRLSQNILFNHPNFQGQSKETILHLLEKFRLLIAKNHSFNLQGKKDVILVSGIAFGDNMEFRGSCYIPQHVSRLTFPPHQVPHPVVFFSSASDVPPLKEAQKSDISDLADIEF